MSSLYDDLCEVIPPGSLVLGNARVGIDAESIEECEMLFEAGLATDMLQRSFTEIERQYIGIDAALFAGRWALKEAVSKAIGTGFRGLDPSEIEVFRASTGQPFVRPAHGAVWPDDASKWSWSVSLSRTGNAAIAIAVGVPESS